MKIIKKSNIIYKLPTVKMREKSKTILVSHKKKFIFIHNYKVAGTSIRDALCVYESNWYWLFSNLMYQLPFLKEKTSLTIPKHADLSQVQKFYNIDDYFVFGLVRNPWDWEVSKYFYMKQTSKHYQHDLAKSFTDFKDYIIWRKNNFKNQIEFFQFKGSIRTDYICKIEEIEKLKITLKKELNINLDLPYKNKSKRDEYRKYYDEESIKIINDIHQPDIKEFNYSF